MGVRRVLEMKGDDNQAENSFALLSEGVDSSSPGHSFRLLHMIGDHLHPFRIGRSLIQLLSDKITKTEIRCETSR